MADLITIDRAVVQQALVALEDIDGPITALLGGLLGSPDADAPGAKVRTAITALRAALAQVEPVQFDPAEALRLADEYASAQSELDGEHSVNRLYYVKSRNEARAKLAVYLGIKEAK